MRLSRWKSNRDTPLSKPSIFSSLQYIYIYIYMCGVESIPDRLKWQLSERLFTHDPFLQELNANSRIDVFPQNFFVNWLN